jgi:hypothetical protein
MKILILCSSYDSSLKERVEALRWGKLEVDVLDILEYKIDFNSGKVISIRPKTKYKVLENFYLLNGINEYARRREVFNYLDRYDLIEIYKCSHYAIHLKDKIQSISLKYIVTPNEVLPHPNLNIKNLYDDAKLFLFQKDLLKNRFHLDFGYPNLITIYAPVNFFRIYDNIDQNILDKFIDYLEIDLSKIIVFVQLDGALSKQKDLLNSIANLSNSIKSKTLFILYCKKNFAQHHKGIKDILENVSLDYLIVTPSATNEQLAMLLKIASISIFMHSSFEDDLFLTSLYSQNHLFLFQPKSVNPIFKNHQIFIDNFDHIKNIFNDDKINGSIFKDILLLNKEKIYNLFHPKNFCEQYIKEVLR